MKQKLYKTLIPLFIVVVIDDIGFGIVFPILGPLFFSENYAILSKDTTIELRNILYSASIASFFLFMFLGSSILGNLSDRFGRRNVIITALFGVVLAYLACAIGIIYHSILLLILGRCLAGFMGGSLTIAQAAIVDISSQESKTKNIALISLASCIGFVIGPLLGGVTVGRLSDSLLHFAIPFFIAALLALINALFLIFTFKETYNPPKILPPIRVTRIFHTISDIFSNKDIGILCVITVFFQISWSMFFQFISVYMVRNFHYDSLSLGAYYGYLGFIFGLSMLLVIRIAMKFMSMNSITTLSLTVQTITIFITAMLESAVGFWVVTIPVVVCVALSYATLTTHLSNCVTEDKQGWIMGVSGSIMAMAWVLASMIISIASLFSLSATFIISAFVCGISVPIFYLYTKKNTMLQKVAV